MSLGWSVRDICAGIGVLIHVFEALDNSKGARASYAELTRELTSLQSALDEIERSGLSAMQTVVDEVVKRCQGCIDTFVSRIEKFKGFDLNRSDSKWSLEIFKKNVRAVEWAMCRKGEIDGFRKAVLSHTAAILSLQITILSTKLDLQVQGNSYVSQEVQGQVELLRQLKAQMHRVASAQSRLIEGFDAYSQQNQLLNTQISSEMATIVHIQDQLQSKIDIIHHAVASIDTNVKKDLSQRIRATAAQNQVIYETLCRECLRALFITDPEIDKNEIESQRGRVIDRSCDWVIQEFRGLLGRDSSCLIWLHGNPGKGKTMIAIALVDDLVASKASDTLLAYYFCDNTSHKRNTLLQVLRSLLRQALLHAWRLNDKTANDLLENFGEKGESMFSSVEALWIELEKLLRSNSLREAYLVIDGLDECDQPSLQTFLAIFAARGLSCASGSSNNAVCKIKWVFLSRNERSIREHLINVGLINIIALEANTQHVSRAVNEFIELKVEQLSKLKQYKQELKDYVAKTLKSKADGSFIWVSLACRELRQPKVSTINTKLVLGKLPTGLLEIYGRIYDQVMTNEHPEMVQFAIQILQSILLAKRPLVLEELAVTAGLPEEARDDKQQLIEFIEQCGSFLVIKTYSWELRQDQRPSEDIRQVCFIHQSAKEYLLQRSGGIISPDRLIENKEIAIRCLDYLDSIDLSVAHFHEADSLTCKYSAGLQYPLRYWLDHGNLASNKMLHEYKLRGKIFARNLYHGTTGPKISPSRRNN